MLNHLAPLFIVGLAFAFLGWAVEVLSSRIERERRKRFPEPEARASYTATHEKP